MKVKGHHVVRETVEVDINPEEIINNLFLAWKKQLPDGSKIEHINPRTGKWFYEGGDYHSDWDVDVRQATEEEVYQYNAFVFMTEVAKNL